MIDILSIDKKIKAHFENMYSKKSNIIKKISEMNDLIQQGNVPKHCIDSIHSEIKQLEKNVYDIDSKIQLNFYLKETILLIESYKRLLNTPIKVSFMITNNQNKQCQLQNKHKQEIINEYIKIAKKYIDILDDEHQEDTQKNIKCNNCTNDVNLIIDQNIYICVMCGSERELFLNVSSYKDMDRIHIMSKYTYNRKSHFKDCMKQYQAKQNCVIPDHIIEDIINELNKHHLLIGDHDTSNEIRYSNITKFHIMEFIKELGYSKQYENINLIYYIITNKKPSNISHLEEKLLQDFDIFSNYYDRVIKNKIGNRKNFINIQYVLYQLLKKHNHKCDVKDFYILKSKEKIDFCDRVTKMCFQELGWNHYPLA